MMPPVKIKLYFILFLLPFLNQACQHKQTSHDPLLIAISKAKPDQYYAKYPAFVKKAKSDAEVINMYSLGLDSALRSLDQCHGLIISGGADVYPEWYGKLADTARCGSFDRYRDTLEIKLIKKAMALKMPILGICRREQIINVSLGGSLMIDIPTDHDTLIKHRMVDWQKCYHEIEFLENSILSKISAGNDKTVNSNHHQAIDRLSSYLKITALAEDGIIEAVEWKNPNDKSFMLAVQWHPERLDSVNTLLSLPIINEFIIEASAYQADNK